MCDKNMMGFREVGGVLEMNGEMLVVKVRIIGRVNVDGIGIDFWRLGLMIGWEGISDMVWVEVEG